MAINILFFHFQEIKITQDFLKVLNGQVALQMSVLLYVLIQVSIFGKLRKVYAQNSGCIPIE